MTNQDYERKKRECFVQFCKDNGIDQEVNISIFDTFDQIFDRSYALGKQEEDDEDTVIQGWVARSKDCPNDLGLRVYTVKPDRRENRNGWNGHGEMSYLIDCRLFPDLTWEDDPQEVEIIIKRKKK